MNNQTDKIFSVSELTKAIKAMLEGRFPFINVAGEISNLRRPASGHIYFTLKDDRSQVKGVLFRTQQRYLEKQPRDGQMVVCRGRITVYEPRGDYQLIVDAMDFHGAGALQLAYEQLKKQLAAEGLFDQAVKKELPTRPDHITLVTSPTGAAVHDFIRIAQKRHPQTRIAVYPVAVQGDNAPGEIRRAIIDINDQVDTDIIVLCRGGGSIEDLWAFNDEQLARTIHASAIPVVNAVGHEIDFTIADFVADKRAPTPSGAAEMLLPDSGHLREQVAALSLRLRRIMQTRIERYHDQLALQREKLGSAARPVESMMLRLDHLADTMHHAINGVLASRQSKLTELNNRLQQQNPLQVLHLHAQHLEDLQQRLVRCGSRIIKDRESALALSVGILDAVSPLSTLGRGYAIVRKLEGKQQVITRGSQVREGDAVEVLLHQGRLECSVLKADAVEERTANPV